MWHTNCVPLLKGREHWRDFTVIDEEYLLVLSEQVHSLGLVIVLLHPHFRSCSPAVVGQIFPSSSLLKVIKFWRYFLMTSGWYYQRHACMFPCAGNHWMRIYYSNFMVVIFVKCYSGGTSSLDILLQLADRSTLQGAFLIREKVDDQFSSNNNNFFFRT